jgi:hypothetical protein
MSITITTILLVMLGCVAIVMSMYLHAKPGDEDDEPRALGLYDANSIKLDLRLSGDEALALAQMCKQIIYDENRRRSAAGREHVNMDNALDKLQRALAEAGYAPR